MSKPYLKSWAGKSSLPWSTILIHERNHKKGNIKRRENDNVTPNINETACGAE
jgi:hypothetical protein